MRGVKKNRHKINSSHIIRGGGKIPIQLFSFFYTHARKHTHIGGGVFFICRFVTHEYDPQHVPKSWLEMTSWMQPEVRMPARDFWKAVCTKRLQQAFFGATTPHLRKQVGLQISLSAVFGTCLRHMSLRTEDSWIPRIDLCTYWVALAGADIVPIWIGAWGGLREVGKGVSGQGGSGPGGSGIDRGLLYCTLTPLLELHWTFQVCNS